MTRWDARTLVAMALVYVIWGSTYLAIRVSVRTVPPLVGAGGRFVAAGLLLLAVLRLRGRLPRLPDRRETAGAALLGCWLLVGGVGVITVSETHVPSNLAAVIASLAAVWVVLFRRAAGEPSSRSSTVAVAVGFVGVAVLLLPSLRGSGAPLGWLALCLVAPVCWSSGSYYGRRLRLPADAFVASGVEMLTAGLVLTAAGILTGERVGSVSAASALALAYLTTASLVAFSAYVWLLGRLPISTVVTHQYVNPVVAVVLGWALLAEPITAAILAGAALIIGAVVVIVRADARARQDAAA